MFTSYLVMMTSKSSPAGHELLMESKLVSQPDNGSNFDEERKNNLKNLIDKFGSRWVKIIKKQNVTTNL